MVEAGCRAVEHHPQRISPVGTTDQAHRQTRSAIVAIAGKLLNWIAHAGVTPGQHRDRLLLLYQYLDELG
jgi:hypothetical protein